MRPIRILAVILLLLCAELKASAQISGHRSLCVGTQTVLYCPTPAGLWYSNDTDVATVSATYAVVTGISPGTAIISYMSDTFEVTVTALHTIMGGYVSTCAGDTIMLTDPLIVTPTWGFSSGWPHYISGFYLNSATGIFSDAVTDTGVIYGDGFDFLGLASCGLVTVDVSGPPLMPAPITGGTSVAVGSSIHLSNDSTGGTWTVSTPSIATVDASGNLHGLASGTDTVFYSLTNSCGHSSVYSIISVTSTETEVSEQESKSEIHVYPNPVKDFLTVSANKLRSITLYDELGRLRKKQSAVGPETKIDVSELPQGLYFLVAETGNNTLRQTISIK